MTNAGGDDIRNSAAWDLIYRLRQNNRRFSYRRRNRSAPAANSTAAPRSNRMYELQTALQHLNAQIRTTFTILPLDLLLLIEDEESESESDSESGDDSSSGSRDSNQEEEDEEEEDDDEVSVSSTTSLRTAATGSRRPGQSTRNEALCLLHNLCSLLEARVNSSLVPLQLSHPGKASSTYPRLARLVRHVERQPEHFELICTPDSAPTPFLFNVSDVSESVEMAAAFDALRDPSQPRPHKRTRQQMLLEAEFMRNQFLEFNTFVNNLQISVGSLDSLAERQGQSRASAGPFTSFATLQRFRRQASAAFRAAFSQFGKCPYANEEVGPTEHKIFLQLPDWEDVLGCDSLDAEKDLPVQLLFMSCLRHDWQPANAYLLRPKHVDACKKQHLCKALTHAHDNERGLEIYVSETPEAVEHDNIPVHVPKDPTSGGRRDVRFKFPVDNIWSLVKGDYFAKTPTMDLVLLAGDRAAVFGIDQRKALAVKLVLGLMLSMDSDHMIGTWNPKHVHSFKPHDKELGVLVSVCENMDTSKPQGLSLAKWDTSSDLGADDEDDLQPIPAFVRLAKVLLQIACGGPKNLKVACHPDGAFRATWKRLRSLVENYMQANTSGDGVNLEVLPFLLAARNCLDSHTLYQKHARTSPSSPRMEVAWRLVFEDILSQIDSRPSLVGIGQPNMSGPTGRDTMLVEKQVVVEKVSITTVVNPAKDTLASTSSIHFIKGACVPLSTGPVTMLPEVVLFDSESVVEGSKEIDRAAVFFEMLDDFHKSYSRFVTARITDSGAESPRRIRVAIIDTGIDFGHLGLQEAKEKGRVKEEWCYSWIGSSNDIKDEDDGLHGTNCAYILHKAAPEAEIYVEKVFQSTSFKSYQAQNIAKAIEHAVETWNVDIISMSFGLRPPATHPDANQDEQRKVLQDYEALVDDIQDAIRRASIAPRIMFAAAANSGKNQKRAFPARYDPWVICVHASDGNGNDGGINPPLQSGINFTTLGIGLELLERRWVAVGKTRRPVYKTAYKSGTSFATPIAAGVAATVLDLAARVSAINDRTKRKLRRCEEMRRALELMSTPSGDQYSFLAPWNHWERHWQTNGVKRRAVWDAINLLFDA